jgi:hypothetical protein
MKFYGVLEVRNISPNIQFTLTQRRTVPQVEDSNTYDEGLHLSGILIHQPVHEQQFRH